MELPTDLRILIEGMQRELAQLRVENAQLREDNAHFKQEVSDLKKEVARLKGLKGLPDIKPHAKPSGMEKGTNPHNGAAAGKRRRAKQHRVAVEDRVLQ